MKHNKDKITKKYFIRDQETWELAEVTKSQYDNYNNATEYFRPKIEGVKGTVQIFGTMDNENEGNFEDALK